MGCSAIEEEEEEEEEVYEPPALTLNNPQCSTQDLCGFWVSE
jgi:hypothetical protein